MCEPTAYEKVREWDSVVCRYECFADMLLKHSRRWYKFKEGDVVVALVPVMDEDGEVVDAGTELKVVHVTPKIFAIREGVSDRYLAENGLDRRSHFLNLERCVWSNSRIRVNQILVKPVGKGV